jgi:hypothetical protein
MENGKPTIVINVSGGCVIGVVSNFQINANVIVRDCDDIRDGDPDPVDPSMNMQYSLW